jgi:hypothetical protein
MRHGDKVPGIEHVISMGWRWDGPIVATVDAKGSGLARVESGPVENGMAHGVDKRRLAVVKHAGEVGGNFAGGHLDEWHWRKRGERVENAEERVDFSRGGRASDKDETAARLDAGDFAGHDAAKRGANEDGVRRDGSFLDDASGDGVDGCFTAMRGPVDEAGAGQGFPWAGIHAIVGAHAGEDEEGRGLPGGHGVLGNVVIGFVAGCRFARNLGSFSKALRRWKRERARE